MTNQVSERKGPDTVSELVEENRLLKKRAVRAEAEAARLRRSLQRSGRDWEDGE